MPEPVIRDIDRLDPDVIPPATALVQLCLSIGIRIFMTETLRTMERQQELWNQGRTEPGKIVTRAKPGQSKHETGRAFDIAFDPAQHGSLYPDDEKLWAVVGAIGEWLGLRWGGRWKSFPDRPHFELPPKARPAPAPAPPPAPSRPTLRLGSREEAVRELQGALNRWARAWHEEPAHPLGSPRELALDGVFGEETDDAVARFQSANGLVADSVVGKLTWQKLDDLGLLSGGGAAGGGR